MKKSQKSSPRKQISLNIPVDMFVRLKLMAEKEHRGLNQKIIFFSLGATQLNQQKNNHD